MCSDLTLELINHPDCLWAEPQLYSQRENKNNSLMHQGMGNLIIFPPNWIFFFLVKLEQQIRNTLKYSIFISEEKWRTKFHILNEVQPVTKQR